MNDAEYRELVVPPPFDALIESVWCLRGEMDAAPEQVVVPDGRVEIVLHLAQPFALIGADNVARTQSSALVAGQLTSPIRVTPTGPADVIGIRFRASTATSVLPVSLGELTGIVAPLSAVHPRLAGALLQAAVGEPDLARRADVVTDALAKFVARPLPERLLVATSALDVPDSPSIAVLADRLGLTVRTFERHMLHHVGLAPKTLHRVLRFRRAFRLLERVPTGRWDRAALAAGYFDQAHMIRDFKEFAGAPPSAFFRSDPVFARALMGGDGADEPMI
jgi:AraC-like DNA-binding protein